MSSQRHKDESVAMSSGADESVESDRVSTLDDARYSQSLERGLAILRCFRPERSVLGIAEIADRLRMTRSTTHRYVITLVALGFLEQCVGSVREFV